MSRAEASCVLHGLIGSRPILARNATVAEPFRRAEIDLATVSANIFEFAAPRMQINLLVRSGWKRERQVIIVGDGERGGGMAYFATALQFQIAPLVNKTG